jgi:hypothetical protein
MKILAIEHERAGVTEEEIRPHLKAEAARVWELYLAGVIRETYFRPDQHAAVLMLECAGDDQARQLLDTLPLVEARLIDFEIIPLIPYPGLARLFADE